MTTTEQTPSQYDVVFMTTKFSSLNEAQQKAPTQMSTHLERSQEFHVAGALLMAGAFLDQAEEPVCTMAVLATRVAAEDYARGDPFVQADQGR